MKKLRIVLGIAAAIAMVIVFAKRRMAVYEDITLNVSGEQDTLMLLPGDCLEQDMYIPYNHLEEISIAFSYQEEVSPGEEVLVEAAVEGEIVMSQKLSVNACNTGGFMDFYVNLDRCEGKTITVSVTNVTPKEVSGGDFALLATGREEYFIDTVSTCRVNDVDTGSCIFCRETCISGYSYYEAVTGAFLVFLVGAVMMEGLSRKRQDRQ